MDKQIIIWEPQESEKDDCSTHVSLKNGNVDCTSIFTTDEIFNSREELVKWTRAVGKQNGFIVSIKKSDSGKTGRRARIVIGCERGGCYQNRSTKKKEWEEQDKKRARLTGTKKCECPFTLKGQKLDNNDDWMLIVVCGVHNHSAAKHLEGHSYAGRLSEEETSLLIELSTSLVRPKEILYALKKRDKFNVSTIKAIYNARQKYRVLDKAGRSQMQHLLGKLEEYKYIEWHTSCNNTDAVINMFWAHPFSVELLRAFPRVLIMDCTYKTNRYRLPLFEIVGVTSTEKTFSIAFVYLASEQEVDYIWALSRLRELMDDSLLPNVIITDREVALINAAEKVFPNSKNLLCRWHINTNVLANCRKLFETKEKWNDFNWAWTELVKQSTEKKYKAHLKALHKKFGTTYKEVLDYVTTSWLNPYKERFVAAWTDECMHYGNSTTNRAESAHAKLKRQLGSSQGNFQQNWEKIHSLLVLQHNDIKSSFGKSLTVVQHDFRPSEFKELRGFISTSALEQILQQSKRANYIGVDALKCGCVIRRTHGLPCAHELAKYKRENRHIPLDCIHPHWRKLDMLPTTTNSETLQLNCEQELTMLAKRFNESDTMEKLQLKKKLRELVSPHSSSLVEPQVKTNTRGRPKGKKNDTSTRRDPSAFEYVLAGEDSKQNQGRRNAIATRKPTIRAKQLVKSKPKARQPRTIKQTLFIYSFPEGLRPYIKHTEDVKADGNCGFRAIAALLGKGEDGWIQLRKDLLHELRDNATLYSEIYGTWQLMADLMHSLDYYESPASYAHWMTLPDMGHLIASRYNIVLYHLSMKQCLTFLPLRSTPMPINARTEIAIGFVNDSHFVQVFLSPNHPVPPIAGNWKRYRRECAEGWATTYTARIQVFKEVVSAEVVTTETIDID